MEASNPPVAPPPPAAVAPPPPAPVAPPPAPVESEYVIVKGDTLSKIAKANGVTVRAIEDANPGVTPTRLKVGQKLVLPAGATGTGANAASDTANGVAMASGGDEVYSVKSGDTLTRIARHYGVTVKAIEAENNLSTTKIKVGQKLNIPARAEAEQAPVNAPPAAVTPPPPAPAPAPAPTAPPPPQPGAPTGQ
jgi:LysM repeat protein